MIYATDLDRTLIYSESFLESNPELNESNKILIDTSKVCSYIHKDVATHLREILSKKSEIRFLPVTTRSIAEFNRIEFRKIGIKVEYAITSNGGTILHNGEPLKEWENYKNSNINIDELVSIARDLEIINPDDYKSKIIDESFIMTKCSIDKVSEQERLIFIDNIKKSYHHYDILTHKSKVYVVPRVVRKDNALTWIKHYINEDEVVSSGDSAFDLPMLSIANLSIIPGHSDLSDKDLKNCRYIRISSGISSPLDTIKILMQY